MVFTRSLPNPSTAPADTLLVANIPLEFRQSDDDLRERLAGVAASGPFDFTGTRTLDTDPLELFPNVVDTASLDRGAGGLTAVARAVTYVGLTEVVANYVLTSPENVWQVVTGLQVVIPGTVFMASGIEHTLGTAIDTSDYIVTCEAQLAYQFPSGTGNVDDLLRFRIYNSTNSTVVGPGSLEALGAAGADGVRTFRAGSLNVNDSPWLSWKGREDLSRIVATTYQVQVCTGLGSGAAGRDINNNSAQIVANANLPAQLMVTVFKR